MKRFFCILLMICVLLTSGCGYRPELGEGILQEENEQDTSELFDRYLQNAYKKQVASDELSLHFSLSHPEDQGILSAVSIYPDISSAGIENDYVKYKDFKECLSSYKYDNLTSRQQLVHDILQEYYDVTLKFQDYPYYNELLSPSSGIHVNLPLLLQEYAFRCKEDVETYLKLIEETDIYFSAILGYEQEKSKAGLFMSDQMLAEVVSFCKNFGTFSQDHLLITSFEKKIQNASFLSDMEKEKYLLANESKVKDICLPSYLRLGEKLSKMKGTGKNDLGLSHFPSGRPYYTLLCRHATGTKDQPFTLYYRISEKRKEDIAAMTSLFSTDPTLASQCTNYRYEATDPAQMLETLKTAIRQDFPASDQTSAVIRTVDSALADSLAPAFYMIAPIDDYKQNIIYYNPSKASSSLDLFTTIAHEGYPGHLYQTAMSYTYGLEPIRTMISFPGYVEGWATYVETLSYDYAGMSPNLANVLQLNYQVVLSLYASADIGIHYYGWDVKKTAEFFKDFGITDQKVIEEIYQMICQDPANYLKYYVGCMEFQRLRREMETKYENFSPMDFHKCILETGPAPFDIVEKELKAYFDDRQGL